MSKKPLNHEERAAKPCIVESLEDRALMSATLGGLTAEQPVATSTAVVLPAVQKTGSFSAPTTSNGIIAILIGL